MPIIDQVAAAMQDVLMTIAQRLARETGFVQRESKLDGATFVQTLAFTYLADPDATLDALTQTAAALNVDITAAGLTQRFTPQAASFLQQVLAVAVQRVLAAEKLSIPVLEQFAGVYIEDSTIVVLPEALRDLWRGCGNASDQGQAALKLTLRLDLATGLLSALSLHDGRRHDSAAAHSVNDLPKQALYLADLGFFSLDRLQQIADQQAFFLSRARAGTKLYDAQGQELALPGWLATQGPTVDVPVVVGKSQQLKARLLAVRVPQEVADQRRRLQRSKERSEHDGSAAGARVGPQSPGIRVCRRPLHRRV